MFTHDDMIAFEMTKAINENAEMTNEQQSAVANYIIGVVEKAKKAVHETEERESRWTAIKADGGEVTVFMNAENAELNEVQRAALKELFEQMKERIKQIVQ